MKKSRRRLGWVFDVTGVWRHPESMACRLHGGA